MCGLFTTIFGSDFTISSIILILGELLFMITFKLLKINQLKEAYAEVICENNNDVRSEELDIFIEKLQRPNKEKEITSALQK